MDTMGEIQLAHEQGWLMCGMVGRPGNRGKTRLSESVS